MKNKKNPIISAYPLKAIPGESKTPPTGQSPYLKAVLASKLRDSYPARVLPMQESNLAAALRYISQSKA
jgi:hypothetical protein